MLSLVCLEAYLSILKSKETHMNRRKGSRRGFAGDDVTQNQDYVETVVPEEDDSYVVEGTDSPKETATDSEVITDQHDVVITEDQGTEEDFVAESANGDAETIDEDGQGREGRRGSRRGDADEDKVEDDVDDIKDEADELEDDVEETEDEDKEERQGRRGRRRGDAVEEVVLNEDGDTEEVDLPEPDETETVERKGAVYGGHSPEHQASIKAAVALAMKDRRL